MKKRKKNDSTSSRQTASSAAIIPRSAPISLMAFTLFLVIVGLLAVAAYDRNSIYKTHVSLWENVAKTAPNKRRAHENYGQALSSAGRYSDALREFKTVMALKDDGSVPLRDLYREVGVVYFRVEMYDDAITAWQTGLRHAPYDPSLLNNLSIVLMQKGRFEEAAAAAQTALAADPNMPQALNTMGQVYLIKKEFSKAAEFFLKALEREPDAPARYWNLALALEQSGQYAKALPYATRYVAMEADPAARQRAVQFIEYLKKRTGS